MRTILGKTNDCGIRFGLDNLLNDSGISNFKADWKSNNSLYERKMKESCRKI